MQQAKRVTCIPATLTPYTSTPIAENHKRRVAGYARVSTDNDEQFTSYQAQVDYYTNFIKSKDEWEFVNVYTDDGISGTSTKHRDGFNNMIADALSGSIDLIITKSVSRFARNTVDSLTTIRKLKDKGVEVYFEKEIIYTFDSKGEMLLTIMSSLAQEESRSISENVTWGVRKRFADGKVTVPFKQFLGYDRGDDGSLVVNQKEAEIIQWIYSMFLSGKSPYTIAKALTEKGIPTPRKNKVWNQSTVVSILSNEKYTGNAILQKTYTPDFLTKKRKTNNGEVPKYYVENSHEAIVTQEQYDIVQQELKNSNRRDCKGLFAGKLICSECGSTFGCKVWHSTDKYRCTIWRCNGKYAGNHKCSTPHLKEEDIKNAFVKAVNKLPFNQKEVVSTLKETLSQILDTSAKEAELEHIEAEIAVTSELVKKSLTTPITATSGEGASGFDVHVSKIAELQKRHQELSDEIADTKHRKGLVSQYLNELEKQENPITEFDENMFNSLVDHGTVYPDEHIVFVFKDGSEIEE